MQSEDAALYLLSKTANGHEEGLSSLQLLDCCMLAGHGTSTHPYMDRLVLSYSSRVHPVQKGTIQRAHLLCKGAVQAFRAPLGTLKGDGTNVAH